MDGDIAFKHEPCNLDDAAYKRLFDIAPDGPHCKHCWPRDAAQEAKDEAAERKVPAVPAKRSDLLVIPKRLALLGIAAAAGVMLLSGSASGVVLSPDVDPAPPAAGLSTPSPSPSCDPATLQGCGDLVIIIEKLIDQQLLRHLTIDHYPEVTPSPSPSPIPILTSPSVPGSSPPATTPIATSRPTPRPTARPTPRPTARPTSPPTTPAPTATPCFRPGNPNSGKDPCAWPVDDK